MPATMTATMTATEAYRANRNAIRAELEKLQVTLAKLDAGQEVRHTDWGYVGDAGRILALLQEATR